MLREMSTAILLLGAVTATELRTNVSHSTYQRLQSQPVASWLSHTKGLGIGINASTAGIGSVDAHYTLRGDQGPWMLGLSPFLGISYAYQLHELPQQVQFSMGLQGLVAYEHYTMSLQYWHMSDGDALGLAWSPRENIGLDLLTLQAGINY